MVAPANVLPQEMTRWLEFHAILSLLGILGGLATGWIWLASLLIGGSFLYGYLTNKESWEDAGQYGGPANLVTAIRLGMMLVAACLVDFIGPWAMGILLGIAASLDGLDGQIARRFDAHSLFGEYLDKETDSFFVTIGGLILWSGFDIGIWILLPALLRPAYVFARRLIELGDKQEPKFRWGRYIAVAMMIAIPVACVMPPTIRLWILATAVAAVASSFARSFFWLFRQHFQHDPKTP